MPQLHLSRRTGRRLLATGAIAAVAVLGAPAVASADPVSDVIGGITGGDNPITGGDNPVTGGDNPVTGGDNPVTGGGEESAPGPEDVENAISAGAECFATAGADLQVAITGLGTGLTEALVGLLGESPIQLPVDGEGDAAGTLQLDQADLEDALAGGAEDVTMVVTVIVDGVQKVVQVVIDLAECLAALVPAPQAPSSTQPSTEPAYTPPATQPAAPVTTQPAAPAQAVAYPGYAPTGGAPSDDSSPAGLISLGALVAATGGGALWLRARRGVAG